MAYPPTFLDLQNEVIAKVGLDATADLQRVKDWINQAYTETCAETEAVQDYATMVLTASVAVYTLDVNLIRIKTMYATPVGSTQSRPLEPISIEEMLELSAGTGASQPSTGGPNRYAVFGVGDVQFYPTPASADTITVYYVKQPTALSANSDVTALPEPYSSRCLIAGASVQAGQFVSAPQVQLWTQEFEIWKGRLRGHLRRKVGAYTRQFRVVGGRLSAPHDPSVDIRGW